MAGRAHVSLIVPASNTVMEPDFRRSSDARLALSVWRLPLESVTRQAEERMIARELPRCLASVAESHPDLVVFGCTSAGSLGGLGHDAAIGGRITDATGVDTVTVVASMVEQLHEIGASRVALFTPYGDELTRSVAACIAEAGYQVVMAEGMGILDNEVIGRMDPDEIVAFVEPRMRGVSADAVFLSCTNWRATETLERLSHALGIPVRSSNQVTLAAVERRLAS